MKNQYIQAIWDWRNVICQYPKKMTFGREESKKKQEKSQRDKKIKEEK